MSTFNIHIETLQAGQPRPYADSVYRARLTFSNTWTSTKGEQPGTWAPSRDLVKEVVKLFVHGFTYEMGDSRRPMLDPYLESLHQEEKPNTWIATVIRPYDD